jgi:hypothetical protein
LSPRAEKIAQHPRPRFFRLALAGFDRQQHFAPEPSAHLDSQGNAIKRAMLTSIYNWFAEGSTPPT